MTLPSINSDRSAVAIFCRLARDPNHISSVLAGFNWRRLELHQCVWWDVKPCSVSQSVLYCSNYCYCQRKQCPAE